MKKVDVLNHGEHGTAPTGHDSIRGSMYVRATRFSAGRSVVPGAFVLAFALYNSVVVQPVLAQTIGRPNVIVDESVLDQLGPPPQTLPDMLLQQQPQNYKPAQRGGDAAGMPTQPSTGQLLPPPSAMPHSRVMLPRALQPATRSPAPPQVARVPKPTPKPVTPVEAAPLVKAPAEPPAPAVVPAEVTPPPAAKIPDAPKIAPPPAPEATAPAVETPKPMAAVPEPSEPPVAKVEMPKAPPPPAPLPKVEPPAPPMAAAPAPKEPEMPNVAAVPPPPAPAVKAPVAEAPPAPKPIRPAPRQLSAAAPATDSKPDSAEKKAQTQIAALPSAPAPAQVLDSGQTYRIPFGSDSSDIPDDGRKYLDELAQRMKSDSALRLQLLGYAGSTQDSASKARRTSLFRALSVRTYLMKQGIRSTRMDVRALGNLVEDGAPDRVDAVVRK